MGKKKKVNPRRIPLAKSAIDKDAIINEAMHDDMFHAWLLVASALVELGFARPDEIHDLSQHVNQYSKTHHPERLDVEKGEKLMGIGDIPRLNVDRVTSPVELEKFKARVRRVALYTALCSICLGLEDTVRFSPDDLHRIFLAADLTEAEIAAGQESYDDLERNLLNKMVKIEMEDGE
jgi:hypothetical protein